MVEKRGAEPERQETGRAGPRGRPWLLGRASSQVLGPRSHRGGAQTDNWKEPRLHPRNPGHFLTETHSPAGGASRGAVPGAQHLGPGPLFRARPGSPLQRRLSERRRPSFPRAGATKRRAEIRKSDSN